MSLGQALCIGIGIALIMVALNSAHVDERDLSPSPDVVKIVKGPHKEF